MGNSASRAFIGVATAFLFIWVVKAEDYPKYDEKKAIKGAVALAILDYETVGPDRVYQKAEECFQKWQMERTAERFDHCVAYDMAGFQLNHFLSESDGIAKSEYYEASLFEKRMIRDFNAIHLPEDQQTKAILWISIEVRKYIEEIFKE